jgi:hypothetical protein
MWDQATYPATVTKECPQFGRLSDPYSFDTDTDPDPYPIRIKGFDDQILEKIYS